MANETIEISIGSPLLRPGITLRTWVSQKYVVSATKELLDKAREINTSSVSITQENVTGYSSPPRPNP